MNSDDNIDTIRRMKLTVIDLNVELQQLSLMHEDTGETYEDVPMPHGDLGHAIQSAFDSTEEAVDVEATIIDDGNNDNLVISAKLC